MSTFEFDSAYSAIAGDYSGEYVPTVEHDDDADILIDGRILADSDWHAITGKTGQYGYRGAVMHPSETADDDTIRQWVRDAGGDTFAVVEVRAYCTEDEPCFPDVGPEYCAEHGCGAEPAGWAVIYRKAGE